MSQTYGTAPAAIGGAGEGAQPIPGGPLSYVHWGPVIGGALVAAATSFVLMTFAAGLGLAIASPSPTWRDRSVALMVLSGFWVLVVAVASMAQGAILPAECDQRGPPTPMRSGFGTVLMDCWCGRRSVIGVGLPGRHRAVNRLAGRPRWSPPPPIALK